MTKKDYIAEALTAHWGERCADNQPGCPCCDAWAQYDTLKTGVQNHRCAECDCVNGGDDCTWITQP